MRQKIFGIASITTTTALFIAACSAAEPAPINEQNINGKEAKGSTKKDGGKSTSEDPKNDPPNQTPSTPGSDGGAPAATGPCGDKATLVECEICCEQNQPKGADFFYAEADKCFCDAPGACKQACAATICNAQPKAPDQACIACLDQNLSCYETAGKACANNADCQLMLKCDADSQCEKKPR